MSNFEEKQKLIDSEHSSSAPKHYKSREQV